MKNRDFRGFISGVLATVFCAGLIGTASASVGRRTMEADYQNIRITLDGKEITPTDANGNVVEPFSVDGTTYLPVRAIGNALGLGVDWDGSTGTVVLTTPSQAPSPESSLPSLLPVQTAAPEETSPANSWEPSASERQILSFSFLRAWIDSHYTSTAGEDHTYSETRSEESCLNTYSITFNHELESVVLEMDSLYNGSRACSSIRLTSEGDTFYAKFSYYLSESDTLPLLTAIGPISSDFSKDSDYTFYSHSGIEKPSSSDENLAKYMYLSSLDWLNSVYSNYVYGDYNLSDFGFDI